MVEADVIVIGAGPAGMAAATQISRAGLAVEIIEQRQSIGGAIYRQPIAGVAAVYQPKQVKARWKALQEDFAAAQIPVRYGHVFLGVDGDGQVLLEDRQSGHVLQRRPKAVLIATGAVEKIAPRAGWQLPGVSTAGGLQVMMKETGRAPAGRVILAGSGPLLIAVAAQLVALGNPPVAIIEAGNPFGKFAAGLALLGSPHVLTEALGYMRKVYGAGVPWLRNSALVDIVEAKHGLLVRVRDQKGRERQFVVDRVGLHDGIRPNNFGLPTDTSDVSGQPLVLRVGDCREALGAVAAQSAGVRAAHALVAALSTGTAPSLGAETKQRHEQALLAKLFAPAKHAEPLRDLSDETVLCRCERATVGDLKTLCSRPDSLTGREIKHNGRFAMGACQGRFCADNTAALMARFMPDQPVPQTEDLTGKRWPIRPVSIKALTQPNSQND